MSLKLVIAETIGIDEKTLNELAKDILPQDVEIKYYNSLADSDEEKINAFPFRSCIKRGDGKYDCRQRSMHPVISGIGET